MIRRHLCRTRAQRLAGSFNDALRGAIFKSWPGGRDADCSWLAGRLGDLYPHETVINHIRRGLSHCFPRCSPSETRNRFESRTKRMGDGINSSELSARDGGGLAALSASLEERCARVSTLKGERLRA